MINLLRGFTPRVSEGDVDSDLTFGANLAVSFADPYRVYVDNFARGL